MWIKKLRVCLVGCKMLQNVAKCKKKIATLPFTSVWCHCKMLGVFTFPTRVLPGFFPSRCFQAFEKSLQNVESSRPLSLLPTLSHLHCSSARNPFLGSSSPFCSSAVSRSDACNRDSSISGWYGVDDLRSTVKAD